MLYFTERNVLKKMVMVENYDIGHKPRLICGIFTTKPLLPFCKMASVGAPEAQGFSAVAHFPHSRCYALVFRFPVDRQTAAMNTL